MLARLVMREQAGGARPTFSVGVAQEFADLEDAVYGNVSAGNVINFIPLTFVKDHSLFHK